MKELNWKVYTNEGSDGNPELVAAFKEGAEAFDWRHSYPEGNYDIEDVRRNRLFSVGLNPDIAEFNKWRQAL